jgi:dipeptidyl aminopeptidase/acylaminoacyl peptidase
MKSALRGCVVSGLLVVALGLCAKAASAQATSAPFTLEQILSYSFPTELTAAPRGNRIAWVFNTNGRRNIWVAAGPNFAARQLTQYKEDDGQEVSNVHFSSDGSTIIYVRGGNQNQAGEVPNPTSDPEGVDQAVWAVSWAGGAPRKIDAGRNPVVSPHPPAAAAVAYVKENQIWIAPLAGLRKPQQVIARGQNGTLRWSPDGRYLAFASNRGSHSLIGIYDNRSRSVRYISPSIDRDTQPRWSLDGKSLAFIRTPARAGGGGPGSFLTAPDQPRPWSIWVADAASGKAREVWKSPETLEGSIPTMAGEALLNWVADGRIVFSSEQDGWMHLYSLDPTGGSPVLLTPGNCEYEHMTFTPDRRAVVYSSNCGEIDSRQLWRVSVTGGEPQAITEIERISWAPVVTGDSRWIAYFGSDTRQPAMPFVRPADGSGAPKMLATSKLPKDFPSDKLIVPQKVVVNSPDGLPVHSQLFLPAACAASSRCPALIFMHGGPVRQMFLGWHNRGYYHRAYAFNQYMASRGYVVMSVNYRSGIGYGRAFREARDRGARGASEYQDIVAAGRYLQSRAEVDPARVGLWGGSYGGYLTAMGLARNSDLFAAGVDLHGVHDWSTRVSGAAGGLTGDRVRVARQASPVADVEKWRSPVLLIHGDDDRNVDFAQTVDLAARLRQLNVPFELMVVPDDVHDFLLQRNWAKILAASAEFFDRYLKK